MVLMMSFVFLEPVASSWLMKTIFSVFDSGADRAGDFRHLVHHDVRDAGLAHVLVGLVLLLCTAS